ncbi:MAG: flagellar basal body rod protein FlgC [Rhodospirillales bacterium]|nr:flagellar basal body rod protein FlgC [Rhodospirillales bacterium]
MDLSKLLQISASGMQAQTTRLRTIAENIANADSLANAPGGKPYQRKIISFKNVLDRTLGVQRVKVDRIDTDKSEFQKRFDPQHPAADPDGNVLVPNVNPMIEVMDMRQAQRSYEANLGVIEVAKSMIARTIELLRA